MLRWLLLLCLLSAPALAEEIDAEVYVAIQAATDAEAAGDLGKAREALEQALPQAESGTLERALVAQRLAYLAIAAQRNAAAIDWLREALAQQQLDEAAALQDRQNLARLLMQAQRYPEAVTELESLPRTDSNRQLLVQAYRQLGQFRKAIPLAEQVVRANPQADDIWYRLLVGMNYELERFDQAVRWQQALLQRAPESVDNWRQLASMQSLAGEQVAAAATLRLAREAGIRLDTTDMENLIALHAQSGAPWQAARLMQALLHEGLLSSSADRLRRLAYLWQTARDHERALAAWERVARSGNSADRLQLAWLQYQQRQWQAALDTLQTVQPANAQQRRQLHSLRLAAEAALPRPDGASSGAAGSPGQH